MLKGLLSQVPVGQEKNLNRPLQASLCELETRPFGLRPHKTTRQVAEGDTADA